MTTVRSSHRTGSPWATLRGSAWATVDTESTFHCQPAVEKALKAFLTWHDRPLRRNRAQTA